MAASSLEGSKHTALWSGVGGLWIFLRSIPALHIKLPACHNNREMLTEAKVDVILEDLIRDIGCEQSK